MGMRLGSTPNCENLFFIKAMAALCTWSTVMLTLGWAKQSCLTVWKPLGKKYVFGFHTDLTNKPRGLNMKSYGLPDTHSFDSWGLSFCTDQQKFQ